tara:strand:+ start:1222 stop:1824 length:603 start_codon:yes stop_codon:yes gene_type:complete
MYCIYKLHNPQFEKFYIGSTANLNKRLFAHKKDSKSKHKRVVNRPLYKYIKDNGGFDNGWKMEILEFTENFRFEKEQLYIDKYGIDNLLNACKSTWLDKDAQKEYMREHRRKYMREHYNKLTYDCPCGKTGLSLKNKHAHIKSRRHLNKIKEIESNNNNIPICCNELTNIFSSPNTEIEVIYDCGGNDVSDLVSLICSSN